MAEWSWLKIAAVAGAVVGGVGGLFWWQNRTKKLAAPAPTPGLKSAQGTEYFVGTPGSAPPVAPGSPLSPTAPPSPSGAYPPPPYGHKTGNTFPNASAMGRRAGLGGDWEKVSVGDYYDPDGKNGVKAIYVQVALTTCSHCRNEAKVLQNMYENTYRPRSAKFITALVDSGIGQSAVDAWMNLYGISFDILADSSRKFVPPGATKTPHHVLIDPRTMKVVSEWDGWPPNGEEDFASRINPLLTKNGG